MKTFLLLTALLVTELIAFSQRFIPVYPESLGDLSVVDQMEPSINNWKTDMIVFDEKLLIGGPMDGFLGFEDLVIAWNGNEFESFGPLPNLPSDKVHSMVIWNNELYIFGKLSEFNHAAKLLNGNWVTAGYNGNAEIYEALVFQDEIIVRTDEQGEENVIRFNGDIWYSLSSADLEPVNDMIVYNEELFMAAGNFIITFDGDSNEVIDTPGYTVFCFSIVDDKLILSGLTDEGEAFFQEQYLDNPWQEFILPIQGEWGGEIGQVLKVDDQFIVNDEFPGTFNTAFLSDSRCYTTGPDSKIPLPFGITEIISFMGKDYALVHGPVDFNFFLRTIEQGNDRGDLFNSALHPYITPSLSNFQVKHLSTAGYRFHNTDPEFETTRSTIYAAAPWYYAVADGETATTYMNYDIGCSLRDLGPVTNNYDLDFMQKYYRVWSLTSQQIQMHQNNLNDPEYEMPDDIRDWPAHGIPGSGESNVLAPFVDMNGDNVYSPELGDYPLIKGDACSYYILNNANSSTSCNFPGDSPSTVPIEMHVMHYLFQSEEPWLENTSFINYRIHNKSGQNIDEFKFGYWVDFDLGTSTDDYVGCNEQLDYYYGYNGDGVDEPSSSSIGYGEFPPAQGVLLLSGEMTSHVYYNNSTNPINGEPSTEQHVINYLNAIWKNGEHVTCGGTGVGGEEECNFIFNTFPWDSGWNEFTSENPPGDRRSVAAFESYSVPANECICIDIALTSALDTTADELPHLASVALLHSYVPEVKEFYATELMSCNCNAVGITEQNTKTAQLNIYPNPASNSVNVEMNHASNGNHSISIYDVMGKIVMQKQELVISNSHTFELDVSSLPNGVYYLQMMDMNQLGSVVPLVIRH